MKDILPVFRSGLFVTVFVLSFFASPQVPRIKYDPLKDSLRYEGETHLRNIRQFTFGGNNAEAYWSFNDKQLVFQSDWNKINPLGCDQIFKMNADSSPLQVGKQYDLVSTGKGRTTCSYFLKDGRIVCASTHSADDKCPESKMFAEGRYV